VGKVLEEEGELAVVPRPVFQVGCVGLLVGEEGGYRVVQLHLLIPVDHLPCSIFFRYVLFNGCDVAYAEITEEGKKVSRQKKQQ